MFRALGTHDRRSGMQLWRTAAALAVWTAASLSGLPAPAQTHGTLIFQDTFSAGSLNTTIWNPFITDSSAGGWPWNYLSSQPFPSSATGRASGYNLDYDLPSYLSTGSGLTMKETKGSTARGYSWTGSTLCSYPNSHAPSNGYVLANQGFTFTDAYVEVKAQMPYTGNGYWPAIWFLPGPGGSGGEIDLHEGGFLSGSIDPDHIMAVNLHTSGNTQKFIDTGVSLSAAYHVYGMQYKQGQYLNMYFDG